MSRKNIIHFPVDFHIRCVRNLACELAVLVEQLGYEKVILDFSNVEKCFPDAVLPIIAKVMAYQHEGVQFSVVLPKLLSLQRTFRSANWGHLMDSRGIKPSEESRFGRLPAKPFSTSDEQYDLVNEVMNTILGAVEYLSRDHLRALEWAVNEISDNVLTHSFSDTGGIVQLSLKPRAKEIELVVCDAGRGIPQTLREGLETSWNDDEALEQAVKEGVTRGTGQGNGLFGSIQVAALSGGAFSINFGKAFLSLARDRNTVIRMDSKDWPGTSVDCSINYSIPMVLERALVFNGIPYISLDIIDFIFSGEEDTLQFEVAGNVKSIGSRISGYEARQKLDNIHKMSGNKPVVVDFRSTGLMSSSFGDEFIAKLIEKYGLTYFRNNFLLSGLTTTNVMILNRSIRQRIGVSLENLA